VVQSLCLLKTLVQLAHWTLPFIYYEWRRKRLPLTDDAGALQATRSLMYSYDDLNTGSFFAGPVGIQTFIDSSIFFSTSHTD